MSFNDGFSSRGVDYISGSDGEVLTRINGQWVAAPNQGAAGTFTGVTLNEPSNLEGHGTSTDPIRVKLNLNVTSVTASFSGDGSQLTNLPLSNYATKTNVTGAINDSLIPYALSSDVSSSFTTPNQVSSSITASIVNFPTRTEVTGVLNNYATLVGVSSSFARLDLSNNFTGNQSVTGFVSSSVGITGSAYGVRAQYTDITASNVTASDVITNYLNFRSSTDPAWDNGRVWYNNSTHELTYWTEVNGFNVKLGQQLVQRCKNDQAALLSKGKVVHISGSATSTDTPRVKLADWTNDNLSANTLGLVAEDIAIGGEGYVIVQGIIKGIDTQVYTPGQMLYLSSSGDYTSTKPSAPKHTVSIGQIVRSANNGSIYVSIQNGYELGELHDVSTNGKSNNDLLIWDSSIPAWKNSSSLGSYTFNGTQTVTGSVLVTSALSASQITGSFSGSGAGLYDIPASSISLTGYAKLDTANIFTVNQTVSGSLFVSSSLSTLDGLTGSAITSSNTLQVGGQSTFGGGVKLPIVLKNTNYSLTASSDYIVAFSGSNLTGTLPNSVGVGGSTFVIKNLHTSSLFITASAGTIDGSTSGLTIYNQYSSYTFISDNTNWLIL